KPKLIVVDELAHTNTPDSRHPKRWQDVQELLDAGVNVWTALNIQHLESLADVVSRITGVAVRETVPDRVLQEAADVVLVDLTPDELIQRLNEGKVYVPETARRATQNFFTPGNLTALRELALRRTADRVDDQMVDYRCLTQIVDHLVVDPIGGAAQRQLAQRRQIAGSEEVLGRPPRRLRHINLAFVEALDELVGREIDKNDVGGRLQDPVRNGLAHGDAGDARDDMGEALEMLDVERRPHVDARVEQLLNVLPALGMAAVGRVGVGELVDDDQLGLALESGVEIELLERAPAIFNPAPRQDFEALDKRARLGAAMSLDEPNDDVDALLFEAPGVLQHGVGLTNAGRGAEKDLQPARSFPADRRQKRVRIGSSRVGSVGWGHRRSYVVMTILTHPAPNSAAKH